MKAVIDWITSHNAVTHAAGFALMGIAVVYLWVTTPHDAVGFGAMAGTAVSLIITAHVTDK